MSVTDEAIASEQQTEVIADEEVLEESDLQLASITTTQRRREVMDCINLVSRIEQVLTSGDNTCQEVNNEFYKLRHHHLPKLKLLAQDPHLLTDIQTILNPLSVELSNAETKDETFEVLFERYRQFHELNLQKRILEHLSSEGKDIRE